MPCRGLDINPDTGRCISEEIDEMHRRLNIEERYYLQLAGETEERQVSVEEFVAAERRAGFRNTMGHDERPATGGFTGSNGDRGRVEYSK